MRRSPLGLLFCAFALSLFAALPAYASPGDVDPLDVDIVGSYVSAVAVQPDGKTIITGLFSSVLGTPRSNIARLNADGTLDVGFDPKASSPIWSIAVQADGKVVLGGLFTTLQPNGAASPTTRRYIARLNADGTLDMAFDPKANGEVNCVAVQADGKIVLGGLFSTLQPNGAASPTARKGIARIHADGTLDTGFDPKAGGTDPYISTIAIQADGEVLLGGYFSMLQPNGAATATTRNHIARVHADGTLDTGFNPNTNLGTVFSIATQADGKVLLGGSFTALRPNGAASATPRQYIARVNADGTLDMTFDPKANQRVVRVAVQADGKILLAGAFTTLQLNQAASPASRQYIARVHADGTLDMAFDPKANASVYDIALETDGKMLLAGDFTALQPNGAATPTARNVFARLDNDPATQSLSAPNASQVQWQRGGAVPEVARVTFELSTNGGTSWSPLGNGSRIGTTANWQLSGLALFGDGQIRARGVTSCDSSGLIEQVAVFSFATDADSDGLLDSWELTYWPFTAGHSAADDFDRDGLTELEELAFGLNPTLPDAALQPAVVAEGGYLTITFPKHPGATYEVQSAGTLLSGQPASFSPATTTVLLDNATTLKVRDNVLLGTPPTRFLRVKVIAAP